MKFQFTIPSDLATCRYKLSAMHEVRLSTGMQFEGKVADDKFSFNYLTKYTEREQYDKKMKKLPHCTLSGSMNSIGGNTEIKGKVTMVIDRLLILTVIFVLALGLVAWFLHSKNGPMRFLFVPAAGMLVFYCSEFTRYLRYRKEALNQFQRIFL